MAVTIAQIDSFTSKLKALLANGFEATLTMEAIKGEAFVTLKAGLGCLWQVPQIRHKIKRRDHAYYRGHEKRKLERPQAVKANTKVVDASNVEENFKGNGVLENISVESGAEEVLGVQEKY